MKPLGLNRKLDYSDYAAIPDDGKRYEVLEGSLFVIPAPSPIHQRVSKRLQRQLEAYFEEGSMGEVFDAPIDLILSPHEILSPSTREHDRNRKAQRYATLGVLHYWIVDPDARRVECFRAGNSGYELVVEAEGLTILTHPEWSDLTIDLAVLWR